MNSFAVAGPTPFIAAALVSFGGGKPTWVVAFLMASCAITVVSVLAVRARSFERGSE
jgi:hypothetical protein